MPTVNLSPILNGAQLFDANGKPLASGTIGTYQAGSSTPLATYTTSAGSVANANPIPLGADGRLPNEVWLIAGSAYKLVVEDVNGNTIQTLDNIAAPGDAVGLASNLASIVNVSLGSALIGWFRNIAGYVGRLLSTKLAEALADSPQDYGAKGDGTDDTAAFTAWLAAIAGKKGYIPATSSYYNLPNGLTISGHSGTRIYSDPAAQIRSSQSSGYLLTITDCPNCDFGFGYLKPGYSGIHMTSTRPNTTDTIVRYYQLIGAGRQATKPADPMANRVGVCIEGPALGNANYYHTIKGKYTTGFDTNHAAHTDPGVGAMNANANTWIDPHMEGYWFGFYTNSVENSVIGARWFAAAGADASHLTECIRLGDGTYATNYNKIQGIAEPGNFSCGVVTEANSLNNWIEIQDNCPFSGPGDAGANDIITHASWNLNKPITLYNASGLLIQGSGALGYTTGAGGSVTQITSKSTGVVLDKKTGQITTHNAALNAGAVVSFVVTCSAVTAIDTVVPNLISGNATAGTYTVSVEAIGSGQFTVVIKNISGGNLSEALVIGYAVLKGAVS